MAGPGRSSLLVAMAAAATVTVIVLGLSSCRKSGGGGGSSSSKKRDRTASSATAREDQWNPGKQDLPPHLQRQLHKEQRRKEKVPLLALKSPMYDNIQMLDPQGRVLSTISGKKANWYVGRKLAEWKDPTRVQLVFEPKGRDSDNVYTVTPKRNVCVVCASDDHIMRHYIVPYAYRSLLPAKYKSHLSHDVVVLCPPCHLSCSESYQSRMKELEGDLRRDPSTAAPSIVDARLYSVRSAALALLRWKPKLPPAKIDSYDKLVRQHLAIDHSDSLSEQQLQQAIDVEYRLPNPTYISGSTLVTDSLMSQDDSSSPHDKIEDFVRGWRKFFLDIAQPRYLPVGWNIDAAVTCSEHKV